MLVLVVGDRESRVLKKNMLQHFFVWCWMTDALVAEQRKALQHLNGKRES